MQFDVYVLAQPVYNNGGMVAQPVMSFTDSYIGSQ